MIFKSQYRSILLQVVLLVAVITIAAFLLVSGFYLYSFILLPVIIYQVIVFYRSQQALQKEIVYFMEAVRYRDFSRHFNVKHSPRALKELHEGFNEINKMLKSANKEKETQYQYLRKVLELVDTGILSYEEQSGTVIWMNESLKQLLQVPYLKTIHFLKKKNAALYETIAALKPGEKSVVGIENDSLTSRIILSATTFQTDGKQYKIIAFQNVNRVIDETESLSWQKLLRVMTHEIMNSVAPISSLAGTLKHRMEELRSAKDGHAMHDLESGLETIKKRSDALLKFTDAYRSLNKVAALNLTVVYVRDLFEDLHNLMQPTLEQKDIEMEIVLKDASLQLQIDKELIEQVMINLILNAIDALKGRDGSLITLAAFTAANTIVIRITDNGAGIPEDISDKIFIPFFSTKKNGNGIGLSLCKRIMLLHKGDIQVHAATCEGTAFSLCFLM